MFYNLLQKQVLVYSYLFIAYIKSYLFIEKNRAGHNL